MLTNDKTYAIIITELRKNKSFGGKQMEITKVIKQYHLDTLRCATLEEKQKMFFKSSKKQ